MKNTKSQKSKSKRFQGLVSILRKKILELGQNGEDRYLLNFQKPMVMFYFNLKRPRISHTTHFLIRAIRANFGGGRHLF